jgi:hypothetical protein
MAQSPVASRASLAWYLQCGNKWQICGVFSLRANEEEEAHMPVLLLWAVPTVIVVGGVGYYFLRAVH